MQLAITTYLYVCGRVVYNYMHEYGKKNSFSIFILPDNSKQIHFEADTLQLAFPRTSLETVCDITLSVQIAIPLTILLIYKLQQGQTLLTVFTLSHDQPLKIVMTDV